MSAEDERDPTEAELERLAAARAALDPSRQRVRRDIVVSAVTDFLAQHGAMTAERLLVAVAQVFQTRAVTSVELNQSLNEAKTARLVVEVNTGGGEVLWQATDGAIADSLTDREWAQRAFSAFESDVISRLVDLGYDLKPGSGELIARRLLRVLSAGCRRASDGGATGIEALRPIEFDRSAVESALKVIQPQTTRDALSSLFLAVLDPDDPFGTDIVHLLVVSSVLVTFIKKRDVAAAASLTGVRLLLDTQLLVRLVDAETPEQRVVQDLIRLSIELGAQVTVAEHSLTEWGRLWSASEREDLDLITESGDFSVAARLMSGNPFIAQFFREKDRQPSLRWARFRADREAVRRTLDDLGVTIRNAGNDSPEDEAFIVEMREAMKGEQTKRLVPRTDRGLEADVQSAAMVSRWRRKYAASICSGYFVGDDTLTRRAYQHVAPADPSPLCVRPETWLLYVAHITGDSADLAEIADVVSSAVLRESFFGMATSYSVNEVADLIALLREDHQPMSLETSREASQLELSHFLDGAAEMSSADLMKAASDELMRRRSARRDGRARRAQQSAEAHLSDSAARVKSAEERAAAAEARADEARAALVNVSSGDGSQRSARDANPEIEKLRRKFRATVALALAAIVILGLTLGGVIHGWGIPFVVAGGMLYALAVVRWARGTKQLFEILLADAGLATWTAIGWVLGNLHHPRPR